MSEETHSHPNYVKIWFILLALLAVSVIGPTFEIKIVTLITAFGVAVVKAYLVARNFMHVNIQPRYVVYILTTCIAFMVLFWAGTAPDVYKREGTNWVKTYQPPAPGTEDPHQDHHEDASTH